MELTVRLNKPHLNQKKILSEAKRFNVLKCGRRFGKTALSINLSSEPMLEGKYVGYWSPTYKDLYDIWTELKYTLHDVIKSKDEQVKQMTLITGGKIDMWSLDDPHSGRGRKYHRCIIDEAEKARHLKDGWEQTIRATLVDYKGDAWFMSTPKFGDTYFKSVLFKNCEKFNDWQSWRFSTYDNPHMNEEEINQAKSQLDDLVFRCEYLAEDVNIVDNPFAWAFNREKHLKKVDVNPDHYLYLSFDFNRNPITCAVIQHYDDTIRVVEQIKLANSDIHTICQQIAIKYEGAMFMITGDATGKNSSAMVRDNINYYHIIQRELNVSMGQIRVPSVNPKIEENQVLVNSILSKYTVEIDPENAQALIYDLENVRLNSDGTIMKGDRNDPKQQADSLDCFRYYLNTFHGNFIKLREISDE